MRKREVKKNFYLNHKEEDELRKKAYDVGLSESELIRTLIKGFAPKEKPGKEFYEEIKNLRQIGNNLNQLSKYANTTGVIKQNELVRIKDLVERFILDLQKKYLVKEEAKIIININDKDDQ